eukprot:6772810-Prymnesium_polylepis.1
MEYARGTRAAARSAADAAAPAEGVGIATGMEHDAWARTGSRSASGPRSILPPPSTTPSD